MAASDLIGALIRMNLAAGAAILLVLVLRRPARAGIGARLAYSLWLTPLLAAVAVLMPARRITAAAIQTAVAAPSSPAVVQTAPLPSLPTVETAAALDPSQIMVGLWLAGALAALVAMTYLQRRFIVEVAKGSVGPAVVGLFTPRIVTPADFAARFSAEEQTLVLAHEEAHIARQDSRLNGLSALFQCLFWFNPLVHLGAHLSRIDQELACDETVVSRFPDARRAYAQALVKAQLAIRPLPLGCYWPSGNEHPLLERIAMLKREDFSRARRVAGGAGLALLCAGVGVAAWASQPGVAIQAKGIPPIAGIPEMTPTGRLIPAFGSHPAGTPASEITATIPEMTPTGAMRGPFEAAPMPPELQLALLAPAQPPAPPAQPGGYTLQTALTDAEAGGVKVVVDGTIARVAFINPQALITLVDANGVETTIASETPNSLLRQGVNREALKAGTPLHIEGFRASNGTIQARPGGMSSNGKPLVAAAAPGQAPGSAPWPQGAVIEQSILTNSVLREGDRNAPPR